MQNDWKVTVAILGARKHYGVQSVLALNDRLERVYTDFYFKNTGLPGLLRQMLLRSSIKSFRRAAMRYSPDLPDDRVRSFPLMGLTYSLALRLAGSEANREKLYVHFGSWFGRSVVRNGFGRANIIYGMNVASIELFQKAGKDGLVCILEQSSAPYIVYDQLFSEEYHLWPDWTKEIEPHRNWLLSEHERQEWDLSDFIICGSQFVADGLELHGVPKEKCRVIPSPVNVDGYPDKKIEDNTSHRKLRVLFLGGVSIMKGIQYVYQALQQLGNDFVETKAAGNILVNDRVLKKMEQHIQFLGLVPRAEIYSLLKWADVLVLPSLCEGSALVTYEALASGIPVITTPNAGSYVQDGITGYIVPIRDPLALAGRLDLLVSDYQLCRNMGIAARHYAEKNLSWSTYGEKILTVLSSVIHD